VGLFLDLGLRRAQRQPQQAVIDMRGEKKAVAKRKSSVSSRPKRKSARKIARRPARGVFLAEKALSRLVAFF
jgi:hypothetical protein